MLTVTGFHQHFEIGRTLGNGSFSTVVEGRNKKENLSFAVKIVKKEDVSLKEEIDLFREIEIQRSLEHENIIKLFSVFSENDAFYLITELVRGGELFDRIILKEQYTEKDSRDVFKTLIETVLYCHQNFVVHRDLKPENLLLLNEHNDSKIKIGDFGFAKRLESPLSLKTQCGSPNYVAPEIIKGLYYGEKVDLWSCGVILYVLLCGYLPFQDPRPAKLFKLVVKADYKFLKEDWKDVSEDAKHLISSLLQIDPNNRLNAEATLQKRWVKKDGRELRQFDRKGSLEKMKTFQATKKFRNAAALIINFNAMTSSWRKKKSPTEIEAN